LAGSGGAFAWAETVPDGGKAVASAETALAVGNVTAATRTSAAHDKIQRALLGKIMGCSLTIGGCAARLSRVG
jgi:hypothetical protein